MRKCIVYNCEVSIDVGELCDKHQHMLFQPSPWLHGYGGVEHPPIDTGVKPPIKIPDSAPLTLSPKDSLHTAK
jgi:hypothetical protein